MEKSMLVPFVREGLDILFVGLNPAKRSDSNGHYFSVNQALWNQLYDAGLTTVRVDKTNADERVFGDTNENFRNWSYGITDLVTNIAESNSNKIKPTCQDCRNLRDTICKVTPKTIILLHGKVLKKFLPFLHHPVPSSNSGQLGNLIPDCSSMFFNIAFPHGNSISSNEKVAQYRAVKKYLSEINQ